MIALLSSSLERAFNFREKFFRFDHIFSIGFHPEIAANEQMGLPEFPPSLIGIKGKTADSIIFAPRSGPLRGCLSMSFQ
jgi:hypothetical protein